MVPLLKQASCYGDADASFMLAAILENGIGVKADHIQVSNTWKFEKIWFFSNFYKNWSFLLMKKIVEMDKSRRGKTLTIVRYD